MNAQNIMSDATLLHLPLEGGGRPRSGRVGALQQFRRRACYAAATPPSPHPAPPPQAGEGREGATLPLQGRVQG
jgi:hypothetical protein